MTGMCFKLSVAALAGAALFSLPAMSAPIAASKALLTGFSVDNSQVVQVRADRGGNRSGAAHRSGSAHRSAAVHRSGAVKGGAVARGGAVVRRGAVVGGTYGSTGGYCDPNYEYCGGSAYYSGGGAAVVRGGAVVKGGAAVRRGVHVSHHRTAGRASVSHHRSGGRRG
jgi:hypothetical protein